MFTTNQDYIKQRMIDFQQEVSQYKLGHRYQSRIKSIPKPFFEKSFVLFFKSEIQSNIRESLLLSRTK